MRNKECLFCEWFIDKYDGGHTYCIKPDMMRDNKGDYRLVSCPEEGE